MQEITHPTLGLRLQQIALGHGPHLGIAHGELPLTTELRWATPLLVMVLPAHGIIFIIPLPLGQKTILFKEIRCQNMRLLGNIYIFINIGIPLDQAERALMAVFLTGLIG